MVVTFRPRASKASVMQLAATSPSSHTVQAPRSQPIFVPVMPRWLRSTSASVVAGSTWTVTVRPLMERDSADGSGPTAAGEAVAAASATDWVRVALSAEAPAPVKKARRLSLGSRGVEPESSSGEATVEPSSMGGRCKGFHLKPQQRM
jgi:hypothetical protein